MRSIRLSTQRIKCIACIDFKPTGWTFTARPRTTVIWSCQLARWRCLKLSRQTPQGTPRGSRWSSAAQTSRRLPRGNCDMTWEAQWWRLCSTHGKAQFGEALLSWGKGAFFEVTPVGWEMDASGRGGTLYAPRVPFRKSVAVSWPLRVMSRPGRSWAVLPGEARFWSMGGSAAERPSGGRGGRVGRDGQRTSVHSVVKNRSLTLERDTVPPKVLPYHSANPRGQWRCGVVRGRWAGRPRQLELRLDGRWARVVCIPSETWDVDASDEAHTRGRPVQAALTAEDEVKCTYGKESCLALREGSTFHRDSTKL